MKLLIRNTLVLFTFITVCCITLLNGQTPVKTEGAGENVVDGMPKFLPSFDYAGNTMVVWPDAETQSAFIVSPLFAFEKIDHGKEKKVDLQITQNRLTFNLLLYPQGWNEFARINVTNRLAAYPPERAKAIFAGDPKLLNVSHFSQLTTASRITVTLRLPQRKNSLDFTFPAPGSRGIVHGLTLANRMTVTFLFEDNAQATEAARLIQEGSAGIECTVEYDGVARQESKVEVLCSFMNEGDFLEEGGTRRPSDPNQFYGASDVVRAMQNASKRWSINQISYTPIPDIKQKVAFDFLNNMKPHPLAYEEFRRDKTGFSIGGKHFDPDVVHRYVEDNLTKVDRYLKEIYDTAKEITNQQEREKWLIDRLLKDWEKSGSGGGSGGVDVTIPIFDLPIPIGIKGEGQRSAAEKEKVERDLSAFFKNKTLEELKERLYKYAESQMNSLSHLKVEWNGTKIIPKSFSLYRIDKNSFNYQASFVDTTVQLSKARCSRTSFANYQFAIEDRPPAMNPDIVHRFEALDKLIVIVNRNWQHGDQELRDRIAGVEGRQK